MYLLWFWFYDSQVKTALIITEFQILNVAPPSNLAIRKVSPDWLSSCTCQRGRSKKIVEEGENKQTDRKKDIFRASKNKVTIIVKRYIFKVNILYRSSGMKLPNCCKLYLHREQNFACNALLQKVLKRLPLINEANF